MLLLSLLLLAADPRPALEAAALSRPGDPAAGKRLFQSAALKCAACHAVDGKCPPPSAPTWPPSAASSTGRT